MTHYTNESWLKLLGQYFTPPTFTLIACLLAEETRRLETLARFTCPVLTPHKIPRKIG